MSSLTTSPHYGRDNTDPSLRLLLRGSSQYSWLVFLHLSQLPGPVDSASFQIDPLKPKSHFSIPLLGIIHWLLLSLREKVKCLRQSTSLSMIWSLITSLLPHPPHVVPLTHSALAPVHLVCSCLRAFALSMFSACCALLPGRHKAPSLSTFKSCSDINLLKEPSSNHAV